MKKKIYYKKIVTYSDGKMEFYLLEKIGFPFNIFFERYWKIAQFSTRKELDKAYNEIVKEVIEEEIY